MRCYIITNMDTNDFELLDYDDIDESMIKTSKKPDDFISIIVDKIYEFDWMMLFCVAIAFIFIMSDVFDENVLNKFKGVKNDNQELTTYGYMIQLISLLIGTVLTKILMSMSY